MMNIRTITTATLALAAGGVTAGAATTVNPPAPGEASHQAIFENAYGVSLSAVGDGFSGGGLTITRVGDDLDTTFGPGSYTVDALGAFASLRHAVGILPGATGGAFESLFTVDGKGFAANGSATFDAEAAFRFARANVNGSNIVSTSPTDNGGLDRVVTYRLTGLPDGDLTVLFFEDLTLGGDADFNDLVLAVAQTPVIPTPVAFVAGAAMLASVSLRRRG